MTKYPHKHRSSGVKRRRWRAICLARIDMLRR